MKKIILALGLSSFTFGASLPGALSVADLDKATRLLAMGGSIRLLRSAESYPLWPGVRVGAEFTLFPGDRLAALGDRLGSVGSFLPIPRVHLAKGLFEGIEVIVSFFPFNLNTVNGGGVLAKWTFLEEKTEWVTLAGVFGVSTVNAFQDEFQGNNLEMGVVVSKDYVVLKPYLGVSLMVARGKVPASLVLNSTETGALLGTHFYMGAEIALPVALSFQLDLINSDPTLSAFAGVRF